MSDNGKGLRTEVLVALIGLIGVVAVALIENWDKIFARSSPDPGPQPVPTATAVPSQIPSRNPIDRSPDVSNSPDPRSPVPGDRSVSIPGTGFPGFSEATDQPLTECTITVERPFVRLMSQASSFSPPVLEVKPGSYSATVYRLVSIGSGAIQEGWFQAQVEGRTGWIDSRQIGAKTGGCP